MTMLVVLAAALGAAAVFFRGGGVTGNRPAWLPGDWLTTEEFNQGYGWYSWGFRRWAKVTAAGIAGAAVAWAAAPDVKYIIMASPLVGLLSAATFALGHSILPGFSRPAYVLRLMDLAPGWPRGVWEGAISGALLVLPIAAWLAWSGAWWPAAIALSGGALKPWCYWVGGLIWKRPKREPDNIASALHGITAWGAAALAVISAI